MSAPATSLARRASALLLAVLLTAAELASPTQALAVIISGSVSVSATNYDTRAPATYVIARFRVPNGETVTGYTVTFPSDTYARNATSPDGAASHPNDRTVIVTYSTPINGPRNNVSLTVQNVVNPSAAGPYSIAQVVFHTTTGNQTIPLGTGGGYTITPAPYLMLTITTLDDPGLLVDFGNVNPGVPSDPKQVTVAVESSAAYTISRTLGGDATALGLAITGTAAGAKPLGAATYTDSYTVAPLWTTDPEIPLSATVVYTATQ